MPGQQILPPFSIQPLLKNEQVQLQPLKEGDFEQLYAVASDPAVWQMHPNKDRYRQAVFKTFFEGAIQSGGAFLCRVLPSGELAGSTRFYHYNAEDNSIFIGYTFYATRFWGTGLNRQVKQLMLDYIFRFVNRVYFHVGAENYRSQKAVEKLGALKLKEEWIAYHGEPDRLNFVYGILREQWPL
ncbi:GNAT family N-acetyltransferase [Niabella drilacis]|uniref:Protein N-acetyltransferase, RimJ/RimL family n=1 Tax=Niabella drilacis (strain DSM 25811 / CCM 8410 / CCUG 62505 / LMG 26954 / E90) TaxID=1285928 RepID=A0A1G7BLJ6_NIADE|nr:GNAT family N-acetyltransferase [Niabella drilacis]SDE27823.1 Protein N-acetyltransferase, RimJ/RimL family [Niabella drilacis]